MKILKGAMVGAAVGCLMGVSRVVFLGLAIASIPTIPLLPVMGAGVGALIGARKEKTDV